MCHGGHNGLLSGHLFANSCLRKPKQGCHLLGPHQPPHHNAPKTLKLFKATNKYEKLILPGTKSTKIIGKMPRRQLPIFHMAR